ncbi:MAG TPA: M10 family metallopeptidase [Sphingomicrobium sp.]|jgi:serralysin|nr:M10 family metallopeptidase [Sphingomicrobium sp.]
MLEDVVRSELDFDPETLEASLDPDAGGTMYGKTIWTPAKIADYITRTNTSWLITGKQSDADQQVINFGFFNTQAEVGANGYTYTLGGVNYGLNEYFGFSAFTEAQRAATREAIGYWDDVVAVSFKETSVDVGDINFGNLTNRPGTQAYARLPAATVSSNATVDAQAYDIVGDVWVTATTASNFQLDEGLYGMNTLVHEFGHSLGLSHPGNYNFAPGFAVTYANGAEYAQDIRNYTIMSYWNPREVGIQDHDYNMGTIAYGSTPMIHDILAAQKLYGVDTTTRTGDSTYGFNASADTAGRDALDFTKTPAPVMTIWDAGGNDTLDASGYATNQVIDLTPGSMSSIGGVTLANAPTLEQVNANRAAAGYAPLSQASYDIRMNNLKANPDAGRLVDNVGIAYGVTIENAVGGAGNDVIIGNSASNRINGNAGNDVISGGAGVDYLTGGTGSDTFIADINGATVVTKRGQLSLDVVTDFVSGTDKIDLSGIDAIASAAGDQAFVFRGSSSSKYAGDLTYKVFDSINGAESALGMEIDGIKGPGAAGPVTVVFGNVDGGAPDFAIALLGARGVTAGDFLDKVVPPAATAPAESGASAAFSPQIAMQQMAEESLLIHGQMAGAMLAY